MIWREVDGRVVGLDLRSSRYFSLNATGSYLWRLLGEGVGREDLAGRLAAEFSLDHEVAARDVSQFLDSLRAGDLLEP